ncbi:MAG: hypothetical protein KF687_15190 [Cyclobacteriaceae bacterium]|nr:hypothetical protein [Cyclobacteriaceae bacterium]
MIEYIPILTTVFSIYFLVVIYRHWQSNQKLYLLWWTLGVLTFGFGTATESINVLFGWSEVNFRLWYISGALLGGFPLAQGSVYLLMKKKFADWSTVLVLTIVGVAAVCIILSPICLPENFDGSLGGNVLSWQWVRYFSPFINLYSFIFLVGGAIYSAVHYVRQQDKQKRFLGNVLIAFGALLPGIGGSFTRAGYVNVLFVTELVGLLLIYAGYSVIRNDKSISIHSIQLNTRHD